jgi:hypothetical protein
VADLALALKGREELMCRLEGEVVDENKSLVERLRYGRAQRLALSAGE